MGPRAGTYSPPATEQIDTAQRTGNFSLAYLLPLLPKNVGVLSSRELLAGGDLHHIGIELEPVAVRIKEIERAAAAATQKAAWTIAPLRSVDQGSLDNIDPFSA